MKTQEIAEYVNGELIGDGSIDIISVADIGIAAAGEIAFWEKADIASPETNASCVIVPASFTSSPAQTVIRIKNPKLAFALAARQLHPIDRVSVPNHPTAIVADRAGVKADYIGAHVSIGQNSDIGEGCRIYEGVRIGKNVTIGKLTIIHSNCVIYDNVEIGEDCTVHAGSVIGADGFGYVRDDTGAYVKFPQIGTVVIENNVEIGANTCIDRGALGETRIGEGTKIDNLVQIAHNVTIGKHVIIAAQTGIAGSTVIEDDCVIGGQVGMGDHARVESGTTIGSQAGVLPGKIVRRGIWWGTPVQPLGDFKRQHAHLKGIARLKAEVRELKASLDRLLSDR